MHADTLREKAKLKLLSDEDLILRVQEGDNDCFDLLVDRYKSRLYNYLFRLVRNEDEAEEIAQETFVKAFIHADKYKTIAKFSTWLYTIATNLVRNRLRAKKRAPRFMSLWGRAGESDDDLTQIDLEDKGRQPDVQFNDKELGEVINSAIEKIPEKYRASCSSARRLPTISIHQIALKNTTWLSLIFLVSREGVL